MEEQRSINKKIQPSFDRTIGIILFFWTLPILGKNAQSSFDLRPEHDVKIFELGSTTQHLKFESTLDTETGKFISNLFGIGQDFEGQIFKFGQSFPWKFRYRLWIDREKIAPPYRPRYQMIERILGDISGSIGKTRVSLGMQEVTWGENLIMPILDVVNPRDITHPYGYYDSQSKIPQPLFIIDQPFANHRGEFIFNPYPFPMNYPQEAVGFQVKKPSRPPPTPKHWEYGARLILTHDSLETKFYFFHHGMRIPTFVFLPYAAGDSKREDILGIQDSSDTYGTSLSIASYQWLFRGDLAFHTKVPATNIATKVEDSSLIQSILGLSTTTLNQQTFGAELHLEHWESVPNVFEQKPILVPESKGQDFMWLGLFANVTYWNKNINHNLIYFHGLDSNDSLFKNEFKGNLSSEASVVLEYQTTFAETSSPKILLGKRDSISTRFSYIF